MARTKKTGTAKKGLHLQALSQGEEKRGRGRPKNDGSQPKKKMKRFAGRPARDRFSTFIYKVLKQVHPDLKISSKAMSIMDSMVHDLLDRIGREASQLQRYNKKPTMQSREIRSATKLVLSGELARHAASEGTKAVAKYEASSTN